MTIEKQLNTLVRKRERLFVRLQLCYDLIKELPDKKAIFVARCADLTSLYMDFEANADEINELNAEVTDTKDRIDTSAPCKQFDIMFYEIKSVYEDVMRSKKLNTDPSTNVASNVQPKLPQIDIGKFGGQLDQFNSFISLFNNLIHSSSIAPIEKFSYLKSLLEGPAFSVVEVIPFDPDHYQLAYDTLVERYTNPRILASHYLNKILDHQPLKSPNLSGIRQLMDVFHINVQALKSLKIDDLSSFIFLQLALRLLDNHTRKAFEQENKNIKFPTFDNLIEFLRSQCAIYELTKEAPKSSSMSKPVHSSSSRKSLIATNLTSTRDSETPRASSTCPMCKDNHHLYKCPQFLELTPTQRQSKVRSLKRCFSCLGSHMVSVCASKSCCRHCSSKKHNSLLHENRPSTVFSNNSNEPSQTQSDTNHSDSAASVDKASAQTLSCRSSRHSSAILSTAKVQVLDSLGNWHICRAVIDGGSQVNFVTTSLAQALGLPYRKCSIDVTGIGNSAHLTAKGAISFKVASRYNQHDFIHVDAIVIPQISSELPATPLPESLQKQLSHLTLADSEFHRPAKIDMLLGAQAFTEILTDGFSLIKGQPSAMHTIFGWVLMGNIETNTNPCKSLKSLFVSTTSTDQLLHKFWEIEEINLPTPLDPENVACEEHFKSTISRDETGRYIASLPFKEGKPPELGSNRETALRRYLNLETRFSKHPELETLYVQNLQDYIQQNHMVLASEPSSYILTHHGVFKDSTTSPLRVVFNASELSNTGISLNKCLMTGPKLQTDISTIITNFRLHKVALTCDIKQMYRAILLSPSDCKYLHIFWRSDRSGPIQEWELQRLTFGLSSSPFIAQRTLKQLVADEGNKFPLAAQALLSSCYVDDVVSGASSEIEAVQMYNQITQLLKSGGFEVHKWASSSTEVLNSISEDHREHPHPLGSTNSIKVLGLEWDPTSDCFHYSITTFDKTPTKRNILSQVARIYDVNGYISPVVFSLKYLLQQLWNEQLDWDEPLSDNMHTKWNKIISEIPLLCDLRIPRCIISTYVSLQLIGFSDASSMGMCAVLYLRIVCENNKFHCNLLQSKTKVAPIKPLTIPRLELCAALLLSRLLKSNTELITKLKIQTIRLFSDSMNVLGWIRTPPHLLHTYVSNRVCEITGNASLELWSHVSGDLNPADCGTRGLLPSNIMNNALWWHGPSFLLQSELEWPNGSYEIPSNLPEIKENQKSSFITHSTPKNYLYDLMPRYSTMNKLQNVMAYVQRFIFNLRHPVNDRMKGKLSITERRNALGKCIQIVQHQHYTKEISALKEGKICTGSLKTLSPFLDQDTLMVGGRLRHAPLPERSKHPPLIPARCHLAQLICDHYHLSSLHGGPRLVQSLIQRLYWIPGVRNLIRKRIFKCLPCYKLKAKPIQPYMADLPPSRFEQGRCFKNVGLDFAGPFLVKESPRRNARLIKCYIALFVCMSIKAIHLELVFSLTTESCLAAIDRFTARRGLPLCIYSDQGRNFIGAARHLQEVYALLKSSEDIITEHLTKQEISWKFIPPHAANFGGLWEAGVKSTKHHLRRVIGESHFTAEEFVTLLCRIESILNSRPLCPVSTSPDDGFDYLSPGHFIIGSPLIARPEEDISQEPLNHLSRWKMITQAAQSFWKIWSKEYIHTQIQRPKWQKNENNLKEGDLVLMYSENSSPLNWPLGRVDKIMPGTDNVVRVVRVRTTSGYLIRPVNKLVALPLNE